MTLTAESIRAMTAGPRLRLQRQVPPVAADSSGSRAMPAGLEVRGGAG